MSKSLLILAAGPLQLPAIETARRLGLRVVALDGDGAAPGLRLADAAHVADITDPEACLEIARRERVNGAIHICSEVSMLALGKINETLGLHGPDLATVLRATNKAQMRRAFAVGGAPSPRSWGAATEPEAWRAAQKLDGPLIVKPSRNSGSRGVTRIEDVADQGRFLAAFRRALAESRDAGTVVEEFIEGPEFSVEIVVWNREPRVVAVTDKVTTGAPFFVETGHSQPTRLGVRDRELVVEAALRGVRALGLDWCAAHAEVRLSSRGPFLMEIGARLGGDFITTELVPRSTGVDMVAAAIRLALGETPDLTPRREPRGAAIRYLTPNPGKVVALQGLEAARRMPGVEILEVPVKPGDTVPPLTSSLTRVGHVIAEGRDAAEAVARAEAARDAVEIVTAS